MSYSTLLAEIKSILSAVIGIGTKVYDYERYAADLPTFTSLFKDGNSIKAWTITRTRTPETAETSRKNIRTHTFTIRGYYSLKDSTATEKIFQSLLEDVCTAFRNKPDLNGKAFAVDPVQINIVEPRMFGDVLCHYGELSINVQEEIQWLES